MLARISGILEQTAEGSILLSLPGAHPGTEQAFEILIPAFLVGQLRDREGQLVTLHTIQSLDSPDGGSSFTPRLIGFASPDERRFFELLTTVKGVGTKKALRSLVSPVSDVARAITLRDAAALGKLPGIGKRLAETIIAELHGKVEAFAGAASSPGAAASGGPPPTGMLSDAARRAVAALVRLGESDAEADRLIRRALEASEAHASADELVAAALGSR
ncbi:MAG: Holliday junction branch migration protein RuvA [Planctomycetota bacterium]|nr:Holliday junction branch migration protein RuvA [Planctomycetota bacterium]